MAGLPLMTQLQMQTGLVLSFDELIERVTISVPRLVIRKLRMHWLSGRQQIETHTLASMQQFGLHRSDGDKRQS